MLGHCIPTLGVDVNDLFDSISTGKYKRSVLVLSTELCAVTGQEDGWLRVSQLRGAGHQPCLWGSVLFLFRDRPGIVSMPLLLLWGVEITALSVKLCEVLR